MRQLIDVDPRLWRRIQALLTEGRYASMNEFVAAAIENQVMLETRSLEEATLYLTKGSREPEALEETGAGSIESGLSLLELSIARSPPQLLEQRERPKNDIAWGLYNRIFPVKITLRSLSQLLAARGEKTVDLKALREQTTVQARLVAQMLGANRRVKGPRGERLFTGLPFRKSDRAADRFGNMFVGSVSLKGKAEGFPALLGFVALKRVEGRPVVSLTEAGFAFAQLRNPVLDRDAGTAIPNRTLSEEEADFYLAHIRSALPREWELATSVLEQIGEGVNTTEGIDQVVRTTVRDLKPALIPPTRSGVISRLGELGLVQRRQDGLKVFYALTERGEAFLKSLLSEKGRR